MLSTDKMSDPTRNISRSDAIAKITLVFILAINAFFGKYPEASGCFSAALLSVVCLYYVIKEKRFAKPDHNMIGAAAMCVGYLFVTMFAVDRGYALLGFFKFLPYILAVFICSSLCEGDRKDILYSVPFIGGLQVLSAVPAYFIPPLKDSFFTYDRFHGGFGYSNAFALFMLCGVIILLIGDIRVKTVIRLVLSAVLLAGILISGSRSVFLLLIPVLVIAVIKNKRLRIPLIAGAGAIILAAGIYGAVSGKFDNIARFLNFSVSESTYFDRLLYYRDALTLILHHPFGLGYRGYQFIVPTVQTGVYSVSFVHCEYLQFILDIGVLPAAVFFVCIFINFFKAIPLLNKLLFGAVLIHCAVDFDLQFLSILLVLPLIAFYDGIVPEPKKKTSKKNKSQPKQNPLKIPIAAVLAALSLVGLYLGTASAAECVDNCGLAVKLYPGLTMSRIVLLRNSADNADAEKTADIIIKRNKYIAYAYDIKARACAGRSDLTQAIGLKNKAISCAPFNNVEYSDKFYILADAISYAGATGDSELMRLACDEMLALPSDMQAALDRVSALGKKITDSPELGLTSEQSDYIMQLKQKLSQ